MPGDDSTCRFCARDEAHVRLVPIFVVSTHPVRKYWACQQCLTDLDGRPARTSAR
jgi:hypothetical protein